MLYDVNKHFFRTVSNILKVKEYCKKKIRQGSIYEKMQLISVIISPFIYSLCLASFYY